MDFIVHHLSPFIVCLMMLLSFLFLYILSRQKPNGQKSKAKPPAEPPGAGPILGHLHLLRGPDPVARTLGGLADKMISPVFSIRLDVERAVVISSWEAVKQCFTINDRVFATRAPSNTGRYLAYDYAAFGLAPYGPYWRDMRKIVMLELLSTNRLDTLEHVRVSELEESMKELQSSTEKNNCVVISKWFEQLALNMVMKTIAGTRYVNSVDGLEEDAEAKQLRRLIKEFTSAAGEFTLSDQIPFPLLRWIDINGSIKNMKRISKELGAIFQSWIDEHEAKRRNKDGDLEEEQDFIDVMLSVIDHNMISHGYARDTIIKATIMIIILASTDASSVFLAWVMSLLLNNEHVMNRAQEEIDNKVGKDRWVDESDIEKLIYLQAIVKETLRLYPPGPLLVPHQAMEDCDLSGYLIPKGTHLLVNAWKLHRDPRIWLRLTNLKRIGF